MSLESLLDAQYNLNCEYNDNQDEEDGLPVFNEKAYIKYCKRSYELEFLEIKAERHNNEFCKEPSLKKILLAAGLFAGFLLIRNSL